MCGVCVLHPHSIGMRGALQPEAALLERLDGIRLPLQLLGSDVRIEKRDLSGTICDLITRLDVTGVKVIYCFDAWTR